MTFSENKPKKCTGYNLNRKVLLEEVPILTTNIVAENLTLLLGRFIISNLFILRSRKWEQKYHIGDRIKFIDEGLKSSSQLMVNGKLTT